MASALLLTHEYQKHGVLSFDISMKKAKNNKTCSRKHVSACVGTSETVAESDGIPYGHMYPFAEKNSLTEYPRSVSDSGEAGSKRKSISLNANVREESHGVGASLSKDEKRELRKKLRLDLEQVRSLSLKLEAKEHQIRSLSYSGFHASYSDAHLSRTENRCSMEKEVTSEPPITQLGNMHFGHNDRKRLERQASFLSSDRIETPGAGGKEKRTPKANQLYLNSEFLSGKERMPPPEKLKPKTASGTKRGQGKDEDLNLKWQRVQSARSRRMIDIMKQCGTVLRKLMVHRHGWVFNEPVDAVKLQLSDYHKVIKRPMDLGTVKRNLEIGQYQSPMEFAEDVRLTFANAMKYNPKENDVHTMADILRRIFEERWKGIREKLEEESLKVQVEDEVLCEKQEKSQQLQDLKRHLRSIEDQIISFEKNTNGKPMAPSRSTVPSNKSKEAPKRAMTFDEKSQLSVNLERLPGEKTQEIIQIIKKRNPSLSQSQIGDAGFEIEVDIDAVDNDTLWELHRFVTNCMKNVKKTKRKTTEAKAVHHMGSNGENVIGFGGDTSVVKNRKNDLEEDVDIDDDMPSAQFPPVVVEKDTVGDASKSSSSSSSSSDSGSSSSDSDSGSSSGSETEAGDS